MKGNIMEYAKFLNEARENATALPYEKMELYKRYTKRFAIEMPRSDSHENIKDAEYAEGAVKYLSQIMGGAPDVILLNGHLIGNTSASLMKSILHQKHLFQIENCTKTMKINLQHLQMAFQKQS